jgi:phosphatidyl-myo-inositol dimannoside synthase
MKILTLLTDAFGGRGGIAKFNRDLLTAMCQCPQIERVIAMPRSIVDKVDYDLLPSKLDYINSGNPTKASFVKSVMKVVAAQPKLDLIICGHLNLLPIAYLVKLWTKAPIFMIMHGYEVWESSPYAILYSHQLPSWQPLVDWINNNILLKQINGLISVSELTLRRFLSWSNLHEIPSFILPNTVNLAGFSPGSRNTTILERYHLTGKTILMTVGRLNSDERYKGFDEILDVLPSLIREIPDLSYMIVGEGTDRARLESKAIALGLEDRVVFTGFIPESEKADHYRLADAYVMPGRGEGFGIVYLEAMACGVPVVASKIDGSREVVRGGLLGIMVDPDNPEEIKTGILEALKRPKGVIPEGLDYFSDRNFEQRVHHICQEIKKRTNPKILD